MRNQDKIKKLLEDASKHDFYDSDRVSLIRQALEIDSSNVEANMMLASMEGKLLSPVQNIQSAIKRYTKIIEISPDHLEAYKRRGDLYFLEDEYDSAITDFSNAIKISPDDVDSYVKRGKTYLYQKNYEQALSNLNRAFLLDPKNSDAAQLLEYAFQRKSDFIERDLVEKIVKEFEEGINFNDPDPKFNIKVLVPLNTMYKRLGLICSENNDYKQAISYCNKALEYHKKIRGSDLIDLGTHNCLGTAYHGLEQYKKAIVEFDKVLKMKPDYPGASEGRSNAIFKLFENQENDFQKKIERFLSGPTSIFKLQDHFFKREKECVKEYRSITKRISISLSLTFITIISGISLLIYKGFDVASIEGNVFSFLPYLGIVLIAAVPAWWTRILLRSRDRWQILQEDCFRKAAIMQYIQATGRDEEFRNQIILETIKHLANRSGADLLVALHTDDTGPYSVTDFAKTFSKNKSKTPPGTN